MTGGIAVALLPSTIRFSPAREEFRGRLEALIVAETDDARGIEDASDALADLLGNQGYNTDQDWIGDDKLTTMDLEQMDTLSDGFNIDPSRYWLETERPLIGNLDSLILGTSLTEERFRLTMTLTFEEQ